MYPYVHCMSGNDKLLEVFPQKYFRYFIPVSDNSLDTRVNILREILYKKKTSHAKCGLCNKILNIIYPFVSGNIKYNSYEQFPLHLYYIYVNDCNGDTSIPELFFCSTECLELFDESNKNINRMEYVEPKFSNVNVNSSHISENMIETNIKHYDLENKIKEIEKSPLLKENKDDWITVVRSKRSKH